MCVATVFRANCAAQAAGSRRFVWDHVVCARDDLKQDFVASHRQGIGADFVYSRFNHPNSEIVEQDKLAVYEHTDSCALFASGAAR